MDQPIYNPSLPYTAYVHGGFTPGRLVRIQGTVNHSSDRFKINLLCGQNPDRDDIALHFNPRFSEQTVVRNSRNYSSWGTEERHGNGFPFTRGQVFEVLILCDESQFKIAVNGQHFTEFNHRVPVERINHINVEGDISITLIQFDGLGGASQGETHQINSSSSPTAPSAPMGLETSASYQNANVTSPMYGSGGAPGFVPPPYPTGPNYGGGPMYPPGPPAPPYSVGPSAGPMYPPMSGGPSPYPPQGAYPDPGGYGHPPSVYPGQPGAYPYQPGAYPGQPQGYPQPMYQNPYGHSSGGGLMGTAGKLLAGVGLAGAASKIIPGLGPSHGHGHYPSGPGHSKSGIPGAGGILGTAAALGAGAIAAKALKPKKMKKKKMLKYGLPLAGVGLAGYGMHKGMHGFRRGSSSSSSSSD